MPPMRWAPTITFGATTLALCLPQRWWEYETTPIGGSRVFASGVPESFIIRTDYKMAATLRFYERELLQVQDWIMYAIAGGSFGFQFDSADISTTFTCYLDAPKFDDGFKPRRSRDYPNVFELEVTLRRLDAVPMLVLAAPDADDCGTGVNTGTVAQAWILTNIANGPNWRLIVGPTPATFGSSLNLANLPNPIVDNLLHRSSAPEGIWDTLILSAGVVIPSIVMMETQGPTADMAWERMGGNFTIKHMRGGVTLAQATSPDEGSGALVTSFQSYDVSAIGPLITQTNDIIRLELNGYAQKKDAVADDGWRNPYYYGAVFGPRLNPRLVVSANVVEL